MSRDEEMKKYLSNCYADGGMVDDLSKDEEDEQKVQDSNPGHSPEDLGLGQAVKGFEAQSDKYGPAQEQAVLDQIQKEHSGVGRNVARSMASFADTAAPAFGGGGGSLKAMDEMEGNEDSRRLAAVPTLSKMNQEQLGQKMALEGMTSSSPLGKSAADTLSGVFRFMGIPESEIPKMIQNPAMAAKVLEPMSVMMGNKEKLQMEALLKQLELGQRGVQIKSETQKAQADIQARKEAQKLDATKEIAKMPWYSRLIHPGVAHELERQAGLGNDTEDNSGEVLRVVQGKKAVFDSATKKFKRWE